MLFFGVRYLCQFELLWWNIAFNLLSLQLAALMTQQTPHTAVAKKDFNKLQDCTTAQHLNNNWAQNIVQLVIIVYCIWGQEQWAEHGFQRAKPQYYIFLWTDSVSVIFATNMQKPKAHEAKINEGTGTGAPFSLRWTCDRLRDQDQACKGTT